MGRAARLGPAAIIVLLAVAGACDGGATKGADDPKPKGEAESGPSVDPELAAAVERGRALFFGDAACMACHKVGDEGTMIVGPNLGVGDDMKQPVAVRAKSSRPDATAAAYVVESILDPDAVVVDGYAAAVMKPLDTLPQGKAIDDAALADLALFVLASGDASTLEADAPKQARDAIASTRKR